MKEVCVLAFGEPPPHWGFKRSRAGTSWYIRLAAERVPACLLALKARGIAAKAIPEPEPEPRPKLGQRGKAAEKRPRGKRNRQRHDGQRYIKANKDEAEAITAALQLFARKQARLDREAEKRRREFNSQAKQRRDRESQARAESLAADFLLKHPQGSA